MDRSISQEVVREHRYKFWRYGTLIALVAVAAVYWMRSALSSSLQLSDIRTAIVETGDVENTLQASGEMQPEFEQVITSPIAAVIQKVYFSAGTPVKSGARILELDKTVTKIEFEKQKDQLDLKRNTIVKTRLDLDKSFFDIKIQDSIKALRINSLKAELENAKRLFKAGGGTRESIEQAETNLGVAQLEKRQLENDIRSRQAIMQTTLRESEISASIQEKELSEFSRRLDQADITAMRNGVLTYVNSNLGSKVSEGDVLARIADLGSFKVIGTISDVYLAQLQVSMPVIIRLNEQLIRGTILSIHPAVSNNTATFEVALDNQDSGAQFRPKMRTEIYPVTAARKSVMRVRNGPAFKSVSAQDVFVLRKDGVAERRTIRTGLMNFDYVEIESGLTVGEQVILTDMSDFKNIREVKIKHP
jgi:HlyD family secretion protein